LLGLVGLQCVVDRSQPVAVVTVVASGLMHGPKSTHPAACPSRPLEAPQSDDRQVGSGIHRVRQRTR
jgi:hypothetical protein